MKISDIKNVKQYYNGDYELIATFETVDSTFTSSFHLTSTDEAITSKIIRDMIANNQYEGEIEQIAKPEPLSQEEINTIINQIKAQGNGNP